MDAGSRTYITHTHSTRQGKAQPPQLADRVHFPRVADQWCFFFLLVFFRASSSFLLLSGRASPRSLWAYIRVVQGSSWGLEIDVSTSRSVLDTLGRLRSEEDTSGCSLFMCYGIYAHLARRLFSRPSTTLYILPARPFPGGSLFGRAQLRRYTFNERP